MSFCEHCDDEESFEELPSPGIPPPPEWLMRTSFVDRERLARLEEVAGAARALISARNRLGVLSLYTGDFERLHAVLGALEAEEDRKIGAPPTQSHYLGMLEE